MSHVSAPRLSEVEHKLIPCLPLFPKFPNDTFPMIATMAQKYAPMTTDLDDMVLALLKDLLQLLCDKSIE